MKSTYDYYFEASRFAMAKMKRLGVSAHHVEMAMDVEFDVHYKWAEAFVEAIKGSDPVEDELIIEELMGELATNIYKNAMACYETKLP